MFGVGNKQHIIWLLFCFLFFANKAFATAEINSVRVWPAPENTRAVFDLSAATKYSYFTLTSPNRLVVDLQNAKQAASLVLANKNDKRIKRIRKSKAKNKGDIRLVFDLVDNYRISVFPLAPAGQYGDRLVIDFYDKNRAKKVVKTTPNNSRDIVIAIDAGHGGEDPGSIGGKGTYEKKVTLAIAKRLQKLIDAEKGMKSVMTRTGDYYVSIDNRTKIARKKQVDFLVSIHADAFHTPKPNGSSVWVISNKRVETELADWLVNREKNSELLGGGGQVIKSTNDDNLAITLADMNKEHSLEVSLTMANRLLKQMRKITKLHKKQPQHASFGVLKASDIPSVLVETGFISNHKEEKNLISWKHQQKLAQAMFDGIKGYFSAYPPMGTYYAAVVPKKHKIVAGESLSIVAQKYKVSVAKLKSMNNLNSNVVRIGQTLKIPRSG